MATLYHGTTLANWEQIQREGWNGPGRKPVWNCSDDSCVYGYELNKADADEENREDWCIREAMIQAMTSAAVLGYLGTTMIVLRLEVPDELVHDDDSCPNMGGLASYFFASDFCPEFVTGVFSSDCYLSSLRLLYISNLIKRNEYVIKDFLSEKEINFVMENNFETESYFALFDDIEWSQGLAA